MLVVDDDPHIRKLILASLRREGYRLCEASNGRAALESMRSEPTDLVVLDLMMPEVSGWDVLAEREKDPALKEIPVIIISASRDPEITKVVNQGICAFMPKPFDLQALQSLVRSCVTPPSAGSTC